MSIVDIIYEKLKQASPETVREVLKYLELLETKANPEVAEPRRTWDHVIAALPGKTGLPGDPVVIQQRLRAEWDRS